MPTPTTPDLITQGRSDLTLLNQKVVNIQNNLTQPPATILPTLISARDSLVAFITRLEAIRDRLIDYEDALKDPATSNLTDWQNALELFDITLTTLDLAIGDGWDIESGRRVKEAYTAVYKIIHAIARALAADDEVPVDDDYILKAILQFVDSFGGVELRLVAGSDIDVPPIYAITNPNGNLITLYHTPVPLLQTDINLWC